MLIPHFEILSPNHASPSSDSMIQSEIQSQFPRQACTAWQVPEFLLPVTLTTIQAAFPPAFSLTKTKPRRSFLVLQKYFKGHWDLV